MIKLKRSFELLSFPELPTKFSKVLFNSQKLRQIMSKPPCGVLRSMRLQHQRVGSQSSHFVREKREAMDSGL